MSKSGATVVHRALVGKTGDSANRCSRPLRIEAATSEEAGTARTESLQRLALARLPTRWGVFEALAFERCRVNCTPRIETAVALLLGDVMLGAPLLRIHSQCLTGELFGSLRCDCAEQLEIAMRKIGKEGRGIFIYEHQEGRGIGLIAKLQAYALQDAGLDTIDANIALGFAPDSRDFTLPAAVLNELGIQHVRLLSNNPLKARALINAGIEVTERLSCDAPPNAHSIGYLRTKKERLGHALTLGQQG
jgi:GTP cyclohydrolase II